MSAERAALSVGVSVKYTATATVFVVSMVVFAADVKTQAADLPNVNPAARKTDLKGSAKDNAAKKDLAQIIDFMMKNGNDIRIGENLAPVIGLPRSMPAKSKNIRNKINGKERDALNCAVIYEETDDSSASGGKKPVCIYLMKVTESPRFQDAQYFRINLDGRLEKVVTNRAKKDDDGKIIPGSGIALDDDLDSSAVRKTFAAEMREVKAWLMAQQNPTAKKAK